MKILVVLNDLELCNGIASYAMNYYELLRNKCKFEFLITNPTIDRTRITQIEKNGDAVYELPQIKYSSLPLFIKKLKGFFLKHNNYDIIHCHVANTALFFLYEAKKIGIPVRIIHAHATVSSDKVTHKLRNDIIQPFTNKLATHYFACSEKAGKSVFLNNNFYVIHNAIVPGKYSYNSLVSRNIKESLGLTENFVIGTVGRMTNQKNPFFMLDIVSKVLKVNKNVRFLYVGSGPLENKIKNKAIELGINNKIIYLKNRNDVHDLYQCIDLFILPSLYEGLPVVGIEAQCSGLTLLVSDTITKEMKLLDTTEFLPLEKPEIWVDKIVNRNIVDRKKNSLIFNTTDYVIEKESEKLFNIYTCLCKGKM